MLSYEQTLEQVIKLPTKIYGLKHLPSIEPYSDNNLDGCLFDWPYTNIEVSEGNKDIVYKCLMRLGTKCRSIMEIGVHRNNTDSISTILMKKKPDPAIYVGIDIEDKSYLSNPTENIFTIKANSHDQIFIRQSLQNLGINKLDLLMIDGWHSVNACINDWMYSDILNDNGVVIMHDSNAHPGPIALYDAIDENLFDKERYCLDDNGIAVAWKK